jgi:adenylate cyclase
VWDDVIQTLQTAMSLDANDADVHRIMAAVNVAHNDLDRALYHQERALALNPNYDLVVVQQGEILTWLGRAEEGIEWIHKAMRLNPYHPERFWSHLGRAAYTAGRYADAAEAMMHVGAMDHTHHALLAAAYARMGDTTAAKAHAREVLAHAPDFTPETFLESLHYVRDEDRAHFRAGLAAAGL